MHGDVIGPWMDRLANKQSFNERECLDGRKKFPQSKNGEIALQLVSLSVTLKSVIKSFSWYVSINTKVVNEEERFIADSVRKWPQTGPVQT